MLFKENNGKNKLINNFIFSIKNVIMYKEDIRMEISEILNIYNNYKLKINDLWRSL